MTYLGYKLGAPEFQNAALEMLAEENEVEWIPYWFGPYDIITKCWNETDFSEVLKLGYYLERGEVYWKYKEFLLFMLDCAVWQGVEDGDAIRNLLRKGRSSRSNCKAD